MFLWTREPMENVLPSCDPRPITRKFTGGYLEGFDTPEGFRVSRLVSTDLKNYLRTEYSPGSTVYKIE